MKLKVCDRCFKASVGIMRDDTRIHGITLVKVVTLIARNKHLWTLSQLFILSMAALYDFPVDAHDLKIKLDGAFCI